MPCRAEIPHFKKLIPEFKDQLVAFISINTRDPKEQVDAEAKRYGVDYPYHYGRDRNINAEFKVLTLPRLIVVKADCTVGLDVPFMKADKLREEINKLLQELNDENKTTTNPPQK